jgi:hypothetical protein
MADVTGSWAGAPAYLRIAFTLSLSTERSARVRKNYEKETEVSYMLHWILPESNKNIQCKPFQNGEFD